MGQLIHVVRQGLPGPGGARHAGLASELPFNADFPCHRGHLVSERGQRVDHAVDRVGQRGDLALRFDRQLPVKSAAGNCRNDPRNAADLTGEIARHEVHVVSQIFPDPRHALHVSLSAEIPFGANLARDAGDFGGKRTQLVHHGVDSVLQFKDFALDIDGDLL